MMLNGDKVLPNTETPQDARFAILPMQAARCEGLTGRDYRVLIAVAGHVNNGNGTCYPSVAAICEAMGLDAKKNRRNVQRALQNLESAGLLIVQRNKGGRGRSNVYHIPRKRVVNPDHPYPAKGRSTLTTLSRAKGWSDSTLKGGQPRPPQHELTEKKDARARASGCSGAALRTPPEPDRKASQGDDQAAPETNGNGPMTGPSVEVEEMALQDRITDPKLMRQLLAERGLSRPAVSAALECPSCGGGKPSAEIVCSSCRAIQRDKRRAPSTATVGVAEG